MGTGIAQNLLQNPGFESAISWDEFWVLSTTDPSTPSAVAREITTDAHEGLKSVELSNDVFLKWTYLLSDVVDAPLRFVANERYVVEGWIKSVEKGKSISFSVFWNGSLDQLIFFNDNPDPVTNPDWFMVSDTITASADFNDGYLSLGFRADKDGALPAGKLLVDDFSVTRLPSTNTEITSFSFAEQTGPASIDAIQHSISLEVPFATDLTALVPSLELSIGATSDPGSGIVADFSLPHVYKVTAEDGITSQDWTVTVSKAAPSSENDILSFSIAEQTGPATIDNVFHTVIVEAVYGTNLSSITPIIGLSPGATINPGSGISTNFDAPFVYRVTAEDGVTTQDYIIVVTLSPVSNQTDIISFRIAEELGPATIDDQLHKLSLVVPTGTDVTALIPTIELSAGATIDPGSGVSSDFTTPVIYRVTAEDGVTVQDWNITVVVQLSDQTEIVSFTIAEQAGPATIDKLWHTVSLKVPYGTDVTALVPTIELSAGASTLPGKGVPGDFTWPLTYTVIAEDGIAKQDWTITVQALANSQTDIENFSIVDEISKATINKLLNTVMVEVPYRTDVTKLVPTIGVSSGAEIFPGSGVIRDFSAPLLYTVTAEDGTTIQEWTVTVVVLLNDQTDIVSFSIVEEVSRAEIVKMKQTVSLEVPNGTDVTALVPTIELSTGATIIPGSGVAADFTAPLTYTVTAANGVTSQDWIITVVVQPNDQADIESFSLAEEASPATINKLMRTVSIEVEPGTDLSTLIPTIELSQGASCDPGSGRTTDFNNPVEYTITAENGVSFQFWLVNVTSNEAVDIKDNETPTGISIYPNPAREFVHIEFSGKADISLFDITGRVAITFKDVTENVRIPVSELNRGTYLVHLKWIDSQQVFRLLLE